MQNMKIVQCKNGHYYDSQKYTYCPHCGMSVSKNEKQPGGKGKRGGWFGKNESAGRQIDEFGQTTTLEADVQRSKGLQTDKTMVMEETIGMIDDIDVPVEEAKTQKLFQNQTEIRTAQRVPDQSVHIEGEKEEEESLDVPPTFAKPPQSDKDKTYGYFQIGRADADPNPVYSEPDTEPVVGWLVCVRGSHFPQTFPLYAGKNTIGRDIGNMVILSGDQSISRNKHAFIIYEPKKRVFFLMAGDGRSLTYLNKKLVTGTQKLKYLDKIEIGTTLLVFIPLCGKSFSWEDYLRG